MRYAYRPYTRIHIVMERAHLFTRIRYIYNTRVVILLLYRYITMNVKKRAGEPGATNYPLSRNIMNYRFCRRAVQLGSHFINYDHK